MFPSDKDYKLASLYEASGTNSSIGIKILTTMDLDKEEQNLVSFYCHKIIDELRMEKAKKDPLILASRQKNKNDLIACFGDNSIYVQNIANEYCSEVCCYDKPWLKVTTKKGPIKIGWRKRVIVVDWTECSVASSRILFPDEDVTKEDYMIHAWGYEKATEYINKILES